MNIKNGSIFLKPFFFLNITTTGWTACFCLFLGLCLYWDLCLCLCTTSGRLSAGGLSSLFSAAARSRLFLNSHHGIYPSPLPEMPPHDQWRRRYRSYTPSPIDLAYSSTPLSSLSIWSTIQRHWSCYIWNWLCLDRRCFKRAVKTSSRRTSNAACILQSHILLSVETPLGVRLFTTCTKY